jgi:ectoine hydroxylase-related dioxygenase (phytanoyl-CoA dioxygenase family)
MRKSKKLDITRPINNKEIKICLDNLDKNGYCKIDNFLTKKTLDNLLELVITNYNKININGKKRYPGTPNRDIRDKIIYNLQNIDIIFLDLISSNSITSIAKKKLNDPFYRFLPEDKPNYVLKYYNARSSGSKLDLHIDSHIPYIGKFSSTMQFVVLLEDSYVENGCTIVVPGSHKSGKFTDRKSSNITNLEGKAGDLIIWDSRLWHGTNENVSGLSRWALVATLSMWWVKPSMDIIRSMNEGIYAQCSDQQKQLLGFCSIPPSNPEERTNTKTGYEFLKKTIREYNL